MDTNIKSSKDNYFIYAIGLICLLNILSSEIGKVTNENNKNEDLINVVSDCKHTSNFLI